MEGGSAALPGLLVQRMPKRDRESAEALHRSGPETVAAWDGRFCKEVHSYDTSRQVTGPKSSGTATLDLGAIGELGM